MGRWLSSLFAGSRRRRGAAYAALLKRYDAYLQLLRANNDFLDLLSDMEAMGASSGLCGWDRMRNTVTRLNVQVFAMARMLGTLSGGRYDGLLPVLSGLGRAMQEQLDRRPVQGPPGPLVLAVEAGEALGEDAAGGKAAHLTALRGLEGARIPPGLVVTTDAFREFLKHSDMEGTVRALWDTLDPEELAHILDTCRTLRERILASTLPPAVMEALAEAAGPLAARVPADTLFAVRSSASGEDSSFSFAGQYDTVLSVAPADVPSAVIRVFAGFFNPGAVMLRLKRGFGALELGMGALVMAMVDGRVSGVAYSRDPSSQGAETVRVEAVPGLGRKLVEGAVSPESHVLDRRDLQAPLPKTSECPSGSSLLSPSDLARVARLALAAAEVLGTPSDVEWTLDGEGALWLIQARPMALRPTCDGVSEPVSGHRILLEGGITASGGAASGPVASVRGPEDALDLPRGFVAVAAESTPDLALLLPRACALVTERGGVTSHLAAVAREYGVPAVFGLEGALRSLRAGEVVTVDAEARRIYEGRVAPLLEAEGPSTALPPASGPVQDALRVLLPLVVPLNLLNPASAEFAPSGCRSLHDVVRFIHEKALAEMVRLPEFMAAGTEEAGLHLRERLPFDLRLIPLGSGVDARAEGTSISLDQVTSAPARALLAGLADPALRREGPRPVDASGFLSVVSGAMAGDSGLGQPGWALVSDRYLHMSLRMGYHFTTAEAFVGPRRGDNRIRLVFKGGAADEVRRQRRARFVAGVLDGLGFQVRRKGDFVSATFSHGTQERMLRELQRLGRLLACAGQLDMVLAHESQVAWYVDGFLQGDYARILKAEQPAEP